MLRGGLGPLRRQSPPPDPEVPEIADLVLISHLHRDHLDLPSLRRFPAQTPVIVPRDSAGWVAKAGAENIHELGVGETISIGDVELTGVKAVHDGYRDAHRGGQIEPLGYLIRRGAHRLLRRRHRPVPGDGRARTGRSCAATHLGLGPLRGRGAPGSGAGGEGARADPAQCGRAVSDPGTLIPLVVRRLLRPCRRQRAGDVPDFVRLAAQLAPEVEVRVVQPGERRAR